MIGEGPAVGDDIKLSQLLNVGSFSLQEPDSGLVGLGEESHNGLFKSNPIRKSKDTALALRLIKSTEAKANPGIEALRLDLGRPAFVIRGKHINSRSPQSRFSEVSPQEATSIWQRCWLSEAYLRPGRWRRWIAF
jgi:hypothetical protein